MVSHRKFWDKTAAKYAKQPIADEKTYQKKLEATRKRLTPDMDVLEIGCGTGSTALAHAPHVSHIRAVDVSQNMVDIAKEKAAAEGVTNVTFERAEVESLNVARESIDAVLALNILHLVEDHKETIGHIHQWLKPGGVFVSSTVCLKEGPLWWRLLIPIGRAFGFVPPVNTLSRKEVERAFTNAGFTVEEKWDHWKGRVLFAVVRKG